MSHNLIHGGGKSQLSHSLIQGMDKPPKLIQVWLSHTI